MTYGEYFGNICVGLSVLVNAIGGGERGQPASPRIGQSILARGFWSRVPMPRKWRQHFIENANWDGF